jgi:hypothetical protein
MKNLRVSIIAALSLLLIFGCRKKDVKNSSRENNSNVVAKHAAGVNESDWQGGNEWAGVEQPQFSIFYSNIKATEITADAAEKGMIRVFKINDSGKSSESVALPFEETIGSQKNYWYYQVTEGNIMISVDVYGSKTNPAAKSLFKYVILSNDVVDGFEKKGTSKSDLMGMSYDGITEATKY